MPTTPFTLELLQAVSDWQRGGDPKQNARRGQRLKTLCADLPDEYRSSPSACFRQIALTKPSVWDLIAEDFLPEKVSSWTFDAEVAKSFKRGVPPPGDWQGVILSIKAPPNGVIVNLWQLYRNPQFLDALDRHKASIDGYAEGAGRYRDSQYEIVLEVESVTQADIYSLGGYSSRFDDLLLQAALTIYERPPTPAEAAHLEWKCEQLRDTAGPRWLARDATERVLRRTKPAAAHLRQVKALQSKS